MKPPEELRQSQSVKQLAGKKKPADSLQEGSRPLAGLSYKTPLSYSKSAGVKLCVDFIKDFPPEYELKTLRYGYYKSKLSLNLKQLDLQQGSGASIGCSK